MSLLLENIRFFEEREIAFGILRPSEVALRKSILDATGPFREFLAQAGIHDYQNQGVGSKSKVSVPCKLIDSPTSHRPSSISLYRPRRGETRLWIAGVRTMVTPGEALLCFWHLGQVWIINASREDARMVPLHSIGELPTTESSHQQESVFEELLAKLRAIGDKGFMRAPVSGSTAIGRLLESELGIAMNSAREADYRGIEIKSSRLGGRRTTMFAQVPNWSKSSLTSSRQILDAFGYDRPEGRGLYCTISVPNVNSQGLFLHLDRDHDLLRVRHDELNPREVVAWEMTTVKERLVSKHSATVWVEAEVRYIGEQEYLRFQAVRLTKHPRPQELPDLLRKGEITVDFLIGPDSDKGYLFKIGKSGMDGLFGHSKRYLLNTEEQN